MLWEIHNFQFKATISCTKPKWAVKSLNIAATESQISSLFYSFSCIVHIHAYFTLLFIIPRFRCVLLVAANVAYRWDLKAEIRSGQEFGNLL